MPYNFKGDKRREFELRLAGYDPFVEAGEQELEEEPSHATCPSQLHP
jgi:hypothetical protein